MAIWTLEIKELKRLYESFKGKLPELEKELGKLIKADDENMILLYSRRCLEVIITDLCECELKRPRKTEPLKGIIDKLHKEEKVPSHIITSMHGLNDLSTYGAHPKDFDPQQVRPVLINLAIILNWYLNSHNIKSPEVEETTEKGKRPVGKKHNLPISATSFVGREKEMKEVRDLFQKSRLVTLTGAGGCGKTRLAREIAFSLIEEYIDGVWFVNLSPITDPDFIAKSIAEVLSIKEEPDKPIIETLINKIKDKSLLILLDNCEHLVQACAEIVDKLLQSAEGIRILATSREALNIYGEVIWMIPSLSFPAPGSRVLIDEIDRYESIKLFTDRAALGKPGFKINTQNVSVISQICSRMEGIPLAIELAATRIKHLGPETILERLEDQFKILSSSSRIAPERQQTLKAAIDWSYDLLSEQEQLLFNRLSVFAGDLSLDAAEEVCQDNKLLKKDILFHLSQLVDKSLIIANSQVDGVVRYRFLEPIRQYSLQKLIASNEEANFRKKHLEYYLKMAEKAYEEQFDAMAAWIVTLTKEHENLCASLEWAESKAPEEYMLLTGSLVWFWRISNFIRTGIKYLEEALEKNKARSRTLARVLFGLGYLTRFREEYKRRHELISESIEIFREIGDHWGEAIALQELSNVELGTHNEELGLKYSEESLKIATETGKKGLIVYCTIQFCLGLVCSLSIDRAKKTAEQLLKSSEELNQIFGIMLAYHFLGDCAILSKNFTESERLYAENMKRCIDVGFGDGVISEMQGVALSVGGQLRYGKATRLNIVVMNEYSRVGLNVPDYKFWQDLIEKHLLSIKEKIGEELYSMYEEEGKNMGFEAAIQYALDYDRD
jgi:predicted ATPase